jgi:hypothetical protein
MWPVRSASLPQSRVEFAVAEETRVDSMHDIKALIARSDKLEARTRQFDSAIVCPLVQGFSLVPVTDDLVRELTGCLGETSVARVQRAQRPRRVTVAELVLSDAAFRAAQPDSIRGLARVLARWRLAKGHKPLQEFPERLHTLIIEISRESPVAYINTFYFGGQGGQDALVWDKGALRFSPTSPGYEQNWPNSPISQALRMIGVVAEAGEDEFDTLGLGKHRETHKWAAR